MLDKQFDNIINKKLQDHQMDGLESDWNVFSQKLKVAMENTDPSDQLFDEAIKSKLADADIESPKPNWAAFSTLLNANVDTGADQSTSDISDEDFDTLIKEKLVNPQIDIPKADWPAFASILAGSTVTPDISDSTFDNVIQNKLQNNSMDIPTPNWNAFSQKLQEASLSDQDLDTEVKSKLENYSTPFNESHWSILRDKMIETMYLRRNLYGLKWFEAALAILLFMTFFNFVADKFIPDAKAIAVTKTAVSSTTTETSELTQAAENLVNSSASLATTNITAEEDSSNDIKNNTRQVTATTTSRNVSNNRKRNLSSLNAVQAGSTPVAVISNAIDSGNGNLNSNTSSVGAFNETDEDLTNTITKSMTIAPAISGLESNHNLNELHLASIKGLKPGLFGFTRDQEELNLAFSIFEKSIELPKKNGWAVHAVIGNNKHIIATPQDTFVFELPYETVSQNLNFDIRVSKEFNQVEIMAGIAFQSMNYGARVTEPIEKDGQLYNFNISNIRYDMIKIPLAARWNYGINKKLSLFADLGISGNILAGSDYTITEELVVESSTEPKPQPTSFSPDDVNPGWENSSLARKNYQKGIFNQEGASLKESIFGTLDTGIGINFQFNNQIESYARGTINQALGQYEIGPNGDSFTTFGLQLGLKYNLEK